MAKRIISAILTLTLLLSIAMPAFAEGEQESTVNWDEFRVISSSGSIVKKTVTASH